jgi:hypothetical protein
MEDVVLQERSSVRYLALRDYEALFARFASTVFPQIISIINRRKIGNVQVSLNFYSARLQKALGTDSRLS